MQDATTAYQRLSDYSRQVLSYRLGTGEPEPSSCPPAGEDYADQDRHLRRLLRLCGIKKPRTVFLFGLGDGSLAGRLATELAPGIGLVVLETDLAVCRKQLDAGGLSWWRPQGDRVLLADSSPWALSSLPASQGLMAAESIVAKQPCGISETLSQAYRLFTTMLGPFPVKAAARADAPSLSLAAIIHPGDEDLPGFVKALPRRAAELVLVWDAEAPPETGDLFRDLPYPVVQAARPLAGDFAAQRNHALSLCRGDWVFFIDADERLPADRREDPGLLAASGLAEWFALPRLTLFPDNASAKAGFGLWPDFQVRLFAKKPGVRFRGRVHEKLEHAAGNLGLALDCPFLHLSHLLKDEAAWARKLSVFDQGLLHGARHRLSADYPHLDLSFFLSRGENALARRFFLAQGVDS